MEMKKKLFFLAIILFSIQATAFDFQIISPADSNTYSRMENSIKAMIPIIVKVENPENYEIIIDYNAGEKNGLLEKKENDLFEAGLWTDWSDESSQTLKITAKQNQTVLLEKTIMFELSETQLKPFLRAIPKEKSKKLTTGTRIEKIKYDFHYPDGANAEIAEIDANIVDSETLETIQTLRVLKKKDNTLSNELTANYTISRKNSAEGKIPIALYAGDSFGNYYDSTEQGLAEIILPESNPELIVNWIKPFDQNKFNYGEPIEIEAGISAKKTNPIVLITKSLNENPETLAYSKEKKRYYGKIIFTKTAAENTETLENSNEEKNETSIEEQEQTITIEELDNEETIDNIEEQTAETGIEEETQKAKLILYARASGGTESVPITREIELTSKASMRLLQPNPETGKTSDLNKIIIALFYSDGKPVEKTSVLAMINDKNAVFTRTDKNNFEASYPLSAGKQSMSIKLLEEEIKAETRIEKTRITEEKTAEENSAINEFANPKETLLKKENWIALPLIIAITIILAGTGLLLIKKSFKTGGKKEKKKETSIEKEEKTAKAESRETTISYLVEYYSKILKKYNKKKLIEEITEERAQSREIAEEVAKRLKL